MPRGLALPVRVAPWGGVATVSGDENDDKIIALALSSDDNENAFNQFIGLGDAMIFDISDPQIRGKIIGRIREIFRKFEIQKRYKLVEESVHWGLEEFEAQGDLSLSFKYFNIESDEIRTFSRVINAATNSGM